jgi:translation initiation factor IF-1
VSREGAIKAEGTVIEVLPNHVFRVALANGHRILAHVSGKARLNFVRIAAGDKVNLEMSPYDLSKGCIVLKEK